MVSTAVLKTVTRAGPERMLRAVQGLTSGAYRVTVTLQDEWRVSGVVANGKAYDVSVGVDGFFACSCADFAYRQAICKHAAMLVLYAENHPLKGEHFGH